MSGKHSYRVGRASLGWPAPWSGVSLAGKGSPRRRQSVGLVLILVCLGVWYRTPLSESAARHPPARITDGEFWRMISEFSEPGGSFPSDNFLSNENAFQEVIPRLKKSVSRGGAYLGVGPEQNFTYVVALQPRVAFIVDIRRMNIAEHLLYKAFLELSTDRADFLSRLFSRERPPGLATDSTVEALFAAYRQVGPSDSLFSQNLLAVKDQLMTRHRFGLSGEDLMNLDHVYEAFYTAGPDMSYSFCSTWHGRDGTFPTYAALMREIDRNGEHHSYLATEENFRVLKELEANNLIIPLVGDFSGDRALRSVGRYLREQGLTVTTFYTSDVEQYLFSQGDAWKRFFSNVAALPIDGSSTFIRSVNRGFRYLPDHPGLRSETRLSPISDLLQVFGEGAIHSYRDVVEMSK